MKMGLGYSVAFLLAIHLGAQGAGLNALLESEELWKKSADAFMGEYQPLGFAFVDGKKVVKSNQPDLLFLDLKV